MTGKTKVRLLSIAALGGMISSLGFAITAAPELDSLYEEYIAATNFSDEELYKIRLTYLGEAAKILDKSILSACISAVCILAMKGQFGRTEAALCSLLYSAVRGERPQLKKRQKKKIVNSKSEIVVYEGYTAQYIPCNLKVLERAIKRCNIRLHQFYRVSLNRFIKEIGGRPSTIGDYIGWYMSDNFQDFWDGEEPYILIDCHGEFDLDGRKIVNLHFIPEPEKFD